MSFASDNTAPASPEILHAVMAANTGDVPSYGADAWTEALTARASEVFERSVAIYPVVTGTAANSLALATLVAPYAGVLCHADSHIATDEGGAPEFFTGGAKLIGLASPDGRLPAHAIDAAMAQAEMHGVHRVRPEAVSLTQSTEWGTVYTPERIEAVAAVCRRWGLGLHMDGARFANAVARLGVSPAGLTWRAGVDVLCLGATKNGALAAEAVIFFDPARATAFERRRKRAGHLWSKSRFLAAQLLAYLDDDLWLRNAAHANAMASRLGEALAATPGVRLIQLVEANEVFAAMPEAMIEALLGQAFSFYRWDAPPDEILPVVRLVTSFATQPTEVARFSATLAEYGKTHAR